MSAMRLGMLYLRSRSAGRAVAVLVAVAMLAWLWRRWGGTSQVTVTLLPLAMPAAAAAAIGIGMGSPFGEGETIASRPLAPLRLGHPGGLLAIAAVALAIAVLRWGVPDGAWTLARNLAGFTGLALLIARLVGGGLSWVGPLGYVALAWLAPRPAQPPPWA